jgi:hypothetical protein
MNVFLCRFDKCFGEFRVTRKEQIVAKAKGVLPTGPNVKFNGIEMNQFLKKFPQSARQKKEWIDPVFKE